jgi:methylphosphotriester-DNA--protein-cysteine methyltransferase
MRFHCAFGTGWLFYSTDERTSAIKHMEEDDGRNVTNVAMECGFNSMNTFYHAKQRVIAAAEAACRHTPKKIKQGV